MFKNINLLQIQKVTTKAIDDVSKSVKLNTEETIDNFYESQLPLSAENWFERTANSCSELSDAIIGQSGWTSKSVKLISSKLGAVAVPASLYSVAALVGTASTGTAISSLSGAALTSSTLAWLGGSVAMGTAVVGIASIGGLLAAPLILKPIAEKYLIGKTRSLDELSKQERALVDACLALTLCLRENGKEGGSLGNKQAIILHGQALQSLLDKSADMLLYSNNWPLLQRRQFSNAFISFAHSKAFAKEMTVNHKPVVIGIATALIFKLLSEGELHFNAAEQDVLDALRRSSTELQNANYEELASYVQGLSPEQLLGLKNNIKGIAHEIRYARLENTDGDEYYVELYEVTNQVGADIRLVNSLTGEVNELQLKATSYGSYIESHFEKYPNIDVLATVEVAIEKNIDTTEILNSDLQDDVASTLKGLSSSVDDNVFESMALAGLLTLSRQVNVILTSDPNFKDKGQKAVSDSFKAGLVAGLFELIV